MPVQMIATFSDSAVEAMSSGKTIFNNGFRSSEGYFFPEQPIFSPMPVRTNTMTPLSHASIGYPVQNQSILIPSAFIKIELIKYTVAGIGIAVVVYVLFAILLPSAKKFTDEKLYPYISDSWDEWRSSNHKQIAEKAEVKDKTNTLDGREVKSNVINYNDYRKRA